MCPMTKLAPLISTLRLRMPSSVEDGEAPCCRPEVARATFCMEAISFKSKKQHGRQYHGGARNRYKQRKLFSASKQKQSRARVSGKSSPPIPRPPEISRTRELLVPKQPLPQLRRGAGVVC